MAAMVRTLPLFCYTSGEEAIAFFLKHGPACPVKFVHLERKYPASHDIFRPYDLIVVPEVRFRKRHMGSISPPPPPTLDLEGDTDLAALEDLLGVPPAELGGKKRR